MFLLLFGQMAVYKRRPQSGVLSTAGKGGSLVVDVQSFCKKESLNILVCQHGRGL